MATVEGLTEAKTLALIDELKTHPQLENQNLDTFTAPFGGTGTWRASSTNGVTGYPPQTNGQNGLFKQHRYTSTFGIQEWHVVNGDIYRRVQMNSVWSNWERVDPAALKEYADNSQNIPTLENQNLDTFTAPFGGTGRWRASSTNGVTGYPPELDGGNALFRQFRYTSQDGVQYWTTPPVNGEVVTFQRVQQSGVWGPWVRQGDSGGGGTPAVGGQARTRLEITGEFSTNEQAYAYEEALAQHQAVTLLNLGNSVNGNPIRALRIGDPSAPAVLLLAGQHGNEIGAPEGALLYAREAALAETLYNYKMCTIVVPRMNPDSWDSARLNANDVNLNRDWADRTQPETQAVASLFSSHNIVAGVDAHNFGYPQEVSLRGADNDTLVSPEVRALANDLYTHNFAAFEAGGHPVREYEHAPVEPGLATMNWSGVERAATILLEVPCHVGYTTVWNPRYSPNPHWQANMVALSFRSTVDYVWNNLDAFVTAKNG